MRAMAMVMTGVGGPQMLQPREIEIGWPKGPSDVLVRMRAAGLNPADTFFRALGTYIASDGPVVLGHDGAGVVEAVGSTVTSVKPGDRVCFCYGGIGGAPGTYAEFSVVPEALLTPLPDAVEMREAAAFPLVAITAWEAIVERAAVRAGEQVLVHGGAGGTGQMAIQIARLEGARIAATVSTGDKAALVEALGCERSINYRDEDFVAAAEDWTGGRGVDVAFDNVGPQVLQRTFAAVAPYGRVVTLMGTPADDGDLSAYNRNLTIHNVMMLTPLWFGLEDRLRLQAGIVQRLMPRLAGGELRVTVAETFPLARAADAHARLEAGGMSGKIVLEIGG
ncbi:MAG: zinc-binding dehydrogenase [Hyphomicrobiaceae bacterium]